MNDVVRFESVQNKIIVLRGKEVILDFAVAELYGVETKRINEAVKNNPEKFPDGYVIQLDKDEASFLRSKISTLEIAPGKGKYSKYNYKAFTEKGLYMLATILKGERAVQTTIAIIEAFAKLRELSRAINRMAQNPEAQEQKSLMQKSGEIVEDLFGDDMSTTSTETEFELNFAVLKFKHTIKRKKSKK
ncbi:MAG: ORF6N domain-containing protein [Muribaculaceae bacterium]|jgi:phage regulator Rha-like protein|nr:ORF6N domain-containing protein [Muribaculaceae bacterium]MBQ2484668.1 ORF6N domain-containing protein [Muribaculaceae bacterium]MBQ4006790.1 ORF6N domain-containing protein [Muribaculaceae bacterium]